MRELINISSILSIIFHIVKKSPISLIKELAKMQSWIKYIEEIFLHWLEVV